MPFSYQLTEALGKIGTAVKDHVPEINDDDEYDFYLEVHHSLRELSEIMAEFDQTIIDLIDGYDAQKFKEALGL